MVVLSTTAEQTLQPGQTISFDNLVTWSGCGEVARSGGPLGLRFENAVYELSFNANVTGETAAEPVQLSISLGGSALPETTMIYTPAAANAVGNVSASTYVRTRQGLSNQVTVTNSGANPIIVSPNASLKSVMQRG